MSNQSSLHKFSAAGFLITLGIVFGDIGTSPIYVMSAIIKNQVLSRDLILGGLSCVFWTLISITTVKYVWLALNADNKGEGGIFALYALVRRYKASWTLIPALIGCATLIADGFITPPISICSAVEGMRIINPDITQNTVQIIVIAILVVLFTFQQFGTNIVGAFFGPVMSIWFIMIAILGINMASTNLDVFNALNPYYAYNLLVNYPHGFWLLGAVFLCTTGGEALYSDLGHCGKQNIRVSWSIVMVCLMLCYMGQAAYLLNHLGNESLPITPFYALMPKWFLPYGVVVATFATIIASQALITGCFTLVNEAMKLKLWPNLKVVYPTTNQGQMYIPAINWLLFVGCVAVVLLFKESSAMEAAYGLAIMLNMLMTTSLLIYLLFVHRKPIWIIASLAVFLFSIEIAFFISNLEKFPHGGWFTFILAVTIFAAMYLFYRARKMRTQHTEFVPIKDYI